MKKYIRSNGVPKYSVEDIANVLETHFEHMEEVIDYADLYAVDEYITQEELVSRLVDGLSLGGLLEESYEDAQNLAQEVIDIIKDTYGVDS